MIEVAASYFFQRALEPRNGRKAEQIDQDFRDAAHLAVLAAPFRHSKLTATKILGDPNNPVHFRDDATADELRAEIMKRIATLQDAGLIDLKALPVAASGIANQPTIDRASTGSDPYTMSISATRRNLFVSNSASVDQCQSLKQTSPQPPTAGFGVWCKPSIDQAQVEKLKADGLGATEIAGG